MMSAMLVSPKARRDKFPKLIEGNQLKHLKRASPVCPPPRFISFPFDWVDYPKKNVGQLKAVR